MENSKHRDTNSRNKTPIAVVREEHKKFSVFDKYEVLEKLGKGSMGEVHACTIKEEAIGGSAVSPAEKKKDIFPFFRICKNQQKTDEVRQQRHEIKERREYLVCYALKTIRLERFDDATIRGIKNEVAILKKLDHPNIVKAHEVYFEKRKAYLVLECCVGGDLSSRAPYSEKAAAQISHDILSAVKYMHDRGVVHRDLKLENILFESDAEDATIKVIDFGLAKDLVERPKALMYYTVGTFYTMAPQVILGKYSSKADLWSIGVVIYILLSHKAPFYHKNKQKMIDRIFRAAYSFDSKAWDDTSNEAKDLINHLLVVHQGIRYDADHALAHEWFRKMNDGTLSAEERSSEAMHANSLVVEHKQLSEMKKVAMYLVAYRSTTEEIMETREIFRRYDKDDSGTLSFHEFQAALQALNYPQDLVTEAFESIDLNQDGEIMYTEFLAATLETRHHIEEERIAEAFDRIDKDDSGAIDKSELQEMMTATCYSKEEIDTIFEQVDLNQDGKISFAEFLSHFREQTSRSAKNVFAEHDREETYTELLGPDNHNHDLGV